MPTPTVNPLVLPSGTGLVFDLGSLVTNVVDNNEVQSVTLSGNPSGGAFTLSYGGQTTTPIPAIPSDPYASFRWNVTLAAGTYDLAVNIPRGGSGDQAVLYQVFDGATALGSATLNQQGDAGNPAPFADTSTPPLQQDGQVGGNGVTISWYPLGRFTLPAGHLSVLGSGSTAFPGHDQMGFDCLRVATTSGTPAVTIHGASEGVASPPGYFGVGSGYQVFPEPAGAPGMLTGTATGTAVRYLASAATTQAALRALSSIGPAAVAVSGDGSTQTPLLARFGGPLGDQALAPMVASDATSVHVAHFAAGGILPRVTITRAADGTVLGPLQLRRANLYYNATVAAMPTAEFFFTQDAPAAKYLVVNNLDNSLANAGGSSWQPVGYAGYGTQVQGTANAAGATATYAHRPLRAGTYRVAATWPHDPSFTSSVTHTIEGTQGSVLAPVRDVGAAQTVTAGFVAPAAPSRIWAYSSAVAFGSTDDIGSGSVTLHGTDAGGSPLSETLAPFTAGTPTGVLSAGVFAAITSVDIPRHLGRTATTSLGHRFAVCAPVDQAAAPSGAVDGGVPWQVLGTYTLNGDDDGLIVTQSNNVANPTFMVSNAVRVERLTPDSAVVIHPGDVVTADWGAGWATSQAGPVPAATGAAVDNRSGGHLYPALPTTSNMKIGWNWPAQNPQIAAYSYTDIMRYSGVALYPVGTFPNASYTFQTNQTPNPYGADNRQLANVPAGDYDVWWDGALDVTLGNLVVPAIPVSSAITGAANNRRTYTMLGNAYSCGPAMIATVFGVPDGGGNYTYTAPNIRILPHGTDPANTPLFSPRADARVAGHTAGRNMDPLGAIGANPTDFADYIKDVSFPSRIVVARPLRVPIYRIEGYAYDPADFPFDFDRTQGVACVITAGDGSGNPGPHGFSRWQVVVIQNYGGPAGDFRTDIGGTSAYNFNGSGTYVYPLDADRFVAFLGPHAQKDDSGGQHPYTMRNVLTNPYAGAYIENNIGGGVPLADIVARHNKYHIDLMFNTSFSCTDACLTALGDYIARHLDVGLKLRVECSNETWNPGPPPYNLASNASKVYYNGDSRDSTDFTCEQAHNHWTLMKAAWVAAGRSGSDFLRVMGTQHGNTGITSQRASYCHAKGYLFDELAVAPYLDNQPALTRGAPIETGFAPLVDRLTAAQHVDLWDVHYTYGGYEGEIPGHVAAMAPYPELAGVRVITYEGGPDHMTLVGGSQPNYYALNHAIVRHPRYFGILQHIFRVYEESGCTAFHVFQESTTDAKDGTQWSAYSGTAQPPYAPGDPAQDAIQVDTPDRQDLIHSVTGGAVNAYAALYGAAATPDFTVSAPPSLSVTQGGTATLAVTIAALDGFAGTVTPSLGSLPSGVTAGPFSPATLAGSGTASATLAASSGATATTATLTVTGTDAADSLAHSASTTLTVRPLASPDFTLSASGPVTVARGSSATSTVTLTPSGGYAGAAALSASGLPSGVTGAFSPTSLAGGGPAASTLTLSASGSAATGTATATVTAVDAANSLTHPVTLSLTVTAPPPPPGSGRPAPRRRLPPLRRP